jgi:diguanylate cyclase (GGDEF)-like protein
VCIHRTFHNSSLKHLRRFTDYRWVTGGPALAQQELNLASDLGATRPIGIMVLDRTGKPLHATSDHDQAALEHHNISSIFEMLHPADVARVRADFRSVADGFKLSSQIRFRMFNGKGELRLMEALICAPRPYLHADGIVITYCDVTVSNTASAIRLISRRIALSRIEETDAALEHALDEAMLASGLSSAALFLPTRLEEPGTFHIAKSRHFHDVLHAGQFQIGPLNVSMPVISQVIEDRTAATITEENDPLLWGALHLPNLPSLYRIIVVPLFSADELQGLVTFGCTSENWELQPETIEFLYIASELMASALARRQSAVTLRDRAFRDPLTQLPNRRLLVDRLEDVMVRIRRSGTWVALLFVDCDGFKAVNDTFGHEAGDEVLVSVADRLQAVCRSGELVARFGGDEFVVMVESELPETMVLALGERIVSALDTTYDCDGKSLRMSASVGVAVHRGDDPHIDSGGMFRRADLAMYRAKELGRNRVELFTEEMEVTTRDRFELTSDLRTALRSTTELALWFQPICAAATGEVAGYEALVRWHHPERGLLFPGSFVQLAEESGQIVELGWHLLELALDHMRRWRADGLVLPTATMAVNVSVKQLLSTGFQSTIESILSNSGVPAELIELEMTESIFADRETVVPRLLALREAGAKLSIDDFGTGYSSLAYLRDLPVDVLKIDKSFVDRLGQTRDDAIVEALVTVAHQLGMKTIAEGVETQLQYDCLRSIGCDQVQGYLLGRPSPEIAPMQASTARR